MPRLLFADQDPVSQRLVWYTLQRLGGRIEFAADGTELVRKAVEAEEEGDPFDVVLLDVRLPELSGLDATRHLRDNGYARPIVAVTASADRHTCVEAGCDEFLFKPYLPRELLATVSAFAGPALD